MRGHRPSILDPADLVNLVNVHLREEPTRNPKEMREVANLPMKVFHSRWPQAQRTAWLHPVGTDKLDFAELSIADAFDEFLAISRVPAL